MDRAGRLQRCSTRLIINWKSTFRFSGRVYSQNFKPRPLKSLSTRKAEAQAIQAAQEAVKYG
jgi:hypothetical protein